MNIRTRLRLTVLVTVAAAITVAAVMLVINQRVNQERARIENVQVILDNLFSLNNLTLEYLMRPEMRVAAQWKAGQDEIGKRLLVLAPVTPEGKAIEELLRQNHERSRILFEQLVAQGPESERTAGREIISGQLRLKIQSMVSGVLQMEMSMRQKVAATQKWMSVLLAALMAVLVAAVAGGSLLFSRSILDPLNALRKSMEVIGAGNLEHRVGMTTHDEIGDLARSFDHMVENLRQAGQELRSASLYARNLIEASLDPLVTISLEGKVTDVNKATEEVTGRSRSELVGTDFSDYFTEPDKARVGYQQVFAKGLVIDYPLVLRHCDGHVTDVLYNASVYHNEAGEVLGVFAAARDFTERKLNEAVNASRLHLVQFSLTHSLDELLEESLNEAEKLTGSVIGFYHFVEDDQISLTLQNWSKSTKAVFCKAEGKGLHYPIDEAGVWVDCVRQGKAVIHNDYASLPNRKGMPEGHATVIRELVVPVFRGKKISAILGVGNKPANYTEKDVTTVSLLADMAFEITERKKGEDKIKELNSDLEQRVIERTSQLAAANKELESFSYSVSHDLRTPLRAIDGFSHILLDDYAGKLDEEGKRLLNVVRDNAQKMGQLIDDILAFSRTSRIEIALSEIDMDGLAHAVVEELRPSVAGVDLQVEIESIPPTRGDRAMMHQVFINLLSNAIKFSRFKNPAMIKVGGSIEADEAIYYVRDTGAGFDMHYADKLFGVFQRLHSIDEFEGTGIGLAIVKRIITRHGGRVWAEGKLNEGATIYFALPTKEKT